MLGMLISPCCVYHWLKGNLQKKFKHLQNSVRKPANETMEGQCCTFHKKLKEHESERRMFHEHSGLEGHKQ